MKSMRARLFLVLGAFMLVLGVCSHDVRPAFASSPYEGDSTSSSVAGLKGANTASGGLGVSGLSGYAGASGAGVKGEDQCGGWGVWGVASVSGNCTGGIGVYGSSSVAASTGVKGDGVSNGVYGSASGTTGNGVQGYASGNQAYGGLFTSAGPIGVKAVSTQSGGTGVTAQGGTGGYAVYGIGAIYSDTSLQANVVKVGVTTRTTGTGNPNGVVIGGLGDEYTNLNGGAGTTLYVKESGAGTSSGWVGK